MDSAPKFDQHISFDFVSPLFFSAWAHECIHGFQITFLRPVESKDILCLQPSMKYLESKHLETSTIKISGWKGGGLGKG